MSVIAVFPLFSDFPDEIIRRFAYESRPCDAHHFRVTNKRMSVAITTKDISRIVMLWRLPTHGLFDTFNWAVRKNYLYLARILLPSLSSVPFTLEATREALSFALQACADRGNHTLAKEIVAFSDTDPRQTINKHPLLLSAARAGDLPLLKELREQGLNVDGRVLTLNIVSDRRTALEVACAFRSPLEVVRYLLQWSLAAGDFSVRNPLVQAVTNGYVEAVQVLLKEECNNFTISATLAKGVQKYVVLRDLALTARDERNLGWEATEYGKDAAKVVEALNEIVRSLAPKPKGPKREMGKDDVTRTMQEGLILSIEAGARDLIVMFVDAGGVSSDCYEELNHLAKHGDAVNMSIVLEKLPRSMLGHALATATASNRPELVRMILQQGVDRPAKEVRLADALYKGFFEIATLIRVSESKSFVTQRTIFIGSDNICTVSEEPLYAARGETVTEYHFAFPLPLKVWRRWSGREENISWFERATISHAALEGFEGMLPGEPDVGRALVRALVLAALSGNVQSAHIICRSGKCRDIASSLCAAVDGYRVWRCFRFGNPEGALLPLVGAPDDDVTICRGVDHLGVVDVLLAHALEHFPLEMERFLGNALRDAVNSGATEIVRSLIKAGAAPGDNMNQAAREGRIEIVEILLGGRVTRRSLGGGLALAVQYNQVEIVRLLLKHGAALHEGRYYGAHPMEEAKRMGLFRIVDILRAWNGRHMSKAG